jgi:hypothetical protein
VVKFYLLGDKQRFKSGGFDVLKNIHFSHIVFGKNKSILLNFMLLLHVIGCVKCETGLIQVLMMESGKRRKLKSFNEQGKQQTNSLVENRLNGRENMHFGAQYNP